VPRASSSGGGWGFGLAALLLFAVGAAVVLSRGSGTTTGTVEIKGRTYPTVKAVGSVGL